MGMPVEHGVRAALAAHGLAAAAGLGARERRDSVFVALLRFAGCSAESHISSAALGDEIATRSAMYGQVHYAEPREFLALLWRRTGEGGRALPRRIATFARALGRMPALFETGVAHCEINEQVARRLGLDQEVCGALRQVFECWNGGGYPAKLRGEAIAVSARVASVAEEV